MHVIAPSAFAQDVAVCGYPLSIFFIVVNEFCERFSYYGMRAVLVLYFKYFLRWDDDMSTSIYHTFVALCYLTPILGAIVADSWLGKFKTIIYLSIVYTLGQVAMAVSAIHDITDTDKDGTPDDMTFHVVMSMVGLFLIALGTGGIKPCVAAFGGDQFSDSQEKQRRTFFSVFYLCINGGSLLSTIITPILRAQECGIHTKQSCYPLAFGVPAALMVVALVVFIVGSGMYYKAEPQGNIMMDVCRCIGFAIKNRYRHRSGRYPKRQHWMDWAEEKYDKLLIAQIKMVLKVLFLYIPLPMFWTLFDQKGALVIQPDQMQTVNPILILTLVPIMDSVIYPLIKKCGLNFTPLKRMTVGMFLAALAFVCAALVQVEIDQYLTFGEEEIIVSVESRVGVTRALFLTKGVRETLLLPANISSEWLLVSSVQFKCIKTPVGGAASKQSLCASQTEDVKAKPQQGNNAVRLKLECKYSKGLQAIVNSHRNNDANVQMYDFATFSTTFTIRSGSESCDYRREFGFGSSYTFLIHSTFKFGPSCHESISAVEDIKPNSVHMALQIPQYFFITAGEVMFSVTGLEFSYSQAPSNMKAVLQAGWLLTVAIGNFIVLIVAELAKIPEQWAEYVLFASLLIAVCFFFSIMAYFYTYMDPAEIEAQFKKNVDDDKDDRALKQKMNFAKDSVESDDEKDENKQTQL
uniref:Solute carrier family 15 member 1 n=1 Tax=Hippocampus comes TaxID=109280 RepID=A0A3Q2XJS6_HIPCM